MTPLFPKNQLGSLFGPSPLVRRPLVDDTYSGSQDCHGTKREVNPIDELRCDGDRYRGAGGHGRRRAFGAGNAIGPSGPCGDGGLAERIAVDPGDGAGGSDGGSGSSRRPTDYRDSAPRDCALPDLRIGDRYSATALRRPTAGRSRAPGAADRPPAAYLLIHSRILRRL